MRGIAGSKNFGRVLTWNSGCDIILFVVRTWCFGSVGRTYWAMYITLNPVSVMKTGHKIPESHGLLAQLVGHTG